MHKCIKCGSPLPPTGECPRCAEGIDDSLLGDLPGLNEPIQVNRRGPEPRPAQPRPPPGPPPLKPTVREKISAAVPGFAELTARPPPPAPRPVPAAARPPHLPSDQIPLAPQSTPSLVGKAAPRAVVPGPKDAPPAKYDFAAEVTVIAPRPGPPVTTAPQVRVPEPLEASVPITDPRRSAAEDLGDEMDRLVTSEGREIHARPAPLWRRAIASAVDFTILSAVLAVYFLVAQAVALPKGFVAKASGIDGWVERLHAMQSVVLPGLLLVAVVAVAYATVFGVTGRTPGRKLAGLKLVDASGLAPAPPRAAVRAALAVLSFSLFLGGFWLALFDRRGQTLHDKLTSTFVVLPASSL